MTVQPLLYHNGKIVGALDPAPLEAETDVPNRMLCRRVLQLRGDIEPGDYYLEVIVRDSKVKNDKGVASQWVDFTVVP